MTVFAVIVSVWLIVIGPDVTATGLAVETIRAAAVPEFTDFAIAKADPVGVAVAAIVVDPESVAAVTSAEVIPALGSDTLDTRETESVVRIPALAAATRVPTP